MALYHFSSQSYLHASSAVSLKTTKNILIVRLQLQLRPNWFKNCINISKTMMEKNLEPFGNSKTIISWRWTIVCLGAALPGGVLSFHICSPVHPAERAFVKRVWKISSNEFTSLSKLFLWHIFMALGLCDERRCLGLLHTHLSSSTVGKRLFPFAWFGVQRLLESLRAMRCLFLVLSHEENMLVYLFITLILLYFLIFMEVGMKDLLLESIL